VRERLPDAALGSDIIVGFPGETDGQFESSLNFFDSVPLTYFHVFPYSSRRGTVAASLPDLLPAAVKKARARRMRELGACKKSDFCSRFVGRKISVLVEAKIDPVTGLQRGFSRNYLPVAIAGESALSNRELDVRIDGFRNGSLTARVSRGDGTAVSREETLASQAQ
jgi:threonylcarbamoyladenosine tRNA methylthiotransferase MtaB